MTVSSDFRDTVGLISSGSIVTEFAGIAIDYVGEDAVQNIIGLWENEWKVWDAKIIDDYIAPSMHFFQDAGVGPIANAILVYWQAINSIANTFFEILKGEMQARGRAQSEAGETP